MKPLLRLIVLAAFESIAMPTIAKPITPTHATPLQKIKHPKEAITSEQAKAILKDMQQKRNDEEKMAVIKASINNPEKGITVNQLTTLMNQFLTDDSKLDCAKHAYQYVTNYKYFLDLVNLFSREEYKYALEEFVRKTK